MKFRMELTLIILFLSLKCFKTDLQKKNYKNVQKKIILYKNRKMKRNYCALYVF